MELAIGLGQPRSRLEWPMARLVLTFLKYHLKHFEIESVLITTLGISGQQWKRNGLGRIRLDDSSLSNVAQLCAEANWD